MAVFTKQGLEFLFENRLMDSRDWFHEHHEIYEKQVLRPMQQLVMELTPAMNKIDPGFITVPAVGKCISRINRDTRFTKDKSLYRSHIWCVFCREKHQQLPAFFVEISPDGYSYGCGYYQANPETMEYMRQLVLRDDPAYLEMQRAHEHMKIFNLYAEWYKRPHFSDQPAQKQFWLDMKNLGYEANGTNQKLLFEGGLAEKVTKDFQLLIPAYNFMMKAEEMRIGKKQQQYEAARGRRESFEW